MKSNKTDALYLGNLFFRKVSPFGETQLLSFTKANVDNVHIPIKWTVLLGDNNTGKTRVLKSIVHTLNLFKQDKDELFDLFNNWATENINSVNKELSIEIEPKENLNERLREQMKTLITEKVEQLSSVIVNVLIGNDKYKSFAENEYLSILTNENLSSEEFSSKGIFKIIDDCSYIIPGDDKNFNFLIAAYGVNRKASKNVFSSNPTNSSTYNLIDASQELINVDDWLMQMDYASKNEIAEAEEILKKIKEILTGGILPNVKDIKIRSVKKLNTVTNYVEFLTDYGWNKLENLGYGYQSSISWILDLAKQMFDFYPYEVNPLSMPAIVLVDEIDLHLHPDWQRKIINHLDSIFPNVQFIVSSHSPLIVQSVDNINLILLKKDGDHVNVSQPDIPTFKGWTIEEILSELMGLDEKTLSDDYLGLMELFDKALDDEDYDKAKDIYDQLDVILHPESSQRKLLRIQMSSITPV